MQTRDDNPNDIQRQYIEYCKQFDRSRTRIYWELRSAPLLSSGIQNNER